ncbi:peptide chain release factor 1 [Bdellovibrio bacteriovorus]|uniref:Peptide chain release factor 1 n=1 Tax=Bdellovibrio bacteriovorus TaxID=959 RepID=A0A150WCQ7_BDEBC|nr:peptide chain release factor 1 [Bdellovibrio bacteriovorus]KYG60766.1 peptide chain release factor 1 [Bdellovibrio bacteriovorus]KYG69035.1 peptide chain release factor 1 [Bdellovibrio bacteriovorus]
MFSKLNEVESRYEEVNMALQRPDIASNQTQYRALMKELGNLEKIVLVYRDFKKKTENLKASKELLTAEQDAEMREMIREEVKELEAALPELEHQLKILLIPKDPNDDKNIILEIRAGAGGDEAALFADELFRGYAHYASTQGWKVEMLSYSEGNAGGAKEIIASITGESVFSKLKYESGVHRVQRVPKTEAAGRIHTSTVTVAVIPEVEVNEIKIPMTDVRIETMRSQGAGGQSVNRTESAVRIVHLPTGIDVKCQEGKSQSSNRERAFQILYAKLQQIEDEKARKEASDTRLEQIGTGDRSERIRTYNFPQTRITDHRIGLTIHQLDQVMNGSFEYLIDPLVANFQAEALKKQTSAQ